MRLSFWRVVVPVLLVIVVVWLVSFLLFGVGEDEPGSPFPTASVAAGAPHSV